MLDGADRGCPFAFQFVGQSGSGKTTQLLPAALAAFGRNKVSPAHMCIRTFARYHPYYEEIGRKYGGGLVRENTNAFGLELFSLVLENLIADRVPLVIEKTLIDPAFEEYFQGLLLEKGYRVDYHVMAVSREDSDLWIERREQATNRRVSGKSADYFYDIMDAAIERLRAKGGGCQAFVWDKYNMSPKYAGTLDSPKLAGMIKEGRMDLPGAYSEDDLRRGKQDFFESFYAGKIAS
jgi:hypothetical protein